MTEHKSIHEALLSVQENMPDIGLDAQGQIGSRAYKYASLPVILGIVLPILQANKIILIQRPTVEGETAVLETILHHVATNTEVVAHTPLPIPTDWQAWGSAVTYARRYSLLPMLGIAPDEDDDAAGAQGYSQAPRQAAPQQQDTSTAIRQRPTQREEHGTCPEHGVDWFKTPNMRSPAHPPVDGGTAWCDKEKWEEAEATA